jgi:uncharacterized membrane protein
MKLLKSQRGGFEYQVDIWTFIGLFIMFLVGGGIISVFAGIGNYFGAEDAVAAVFTGGGSVIASIITLVLLIMVIYRLFFRRRRMERLEKEKKAKEEANRIRDNIRDEDLFKVYMSYREGH